MTEVTEFYGSYIKLPKSRCHDGFKLDDIFRYKSLVYSISGVSISESSQDRKKADVLSAKGI
jgi:hypothetical protein